MSYFFERGRIYNRRRDIHEQFSGQRQGGIITPAHHPLVIVITGEAGEQHGYADEMRGDGTFAYFGEGQVGDMKLTNGNRAILDHSRNGKALLLFRKMGRAGLRFEGEWVCEGYETARAPDRNGDLREAFVFLLKPLETVDHGDDEQPTNHVDLASLRAAAIAAASAGQQIGTTSRTVYQRSRDVRAYVLRRAAGRCEGCRCEAPFLRPDGSPYLEPHHIRRVSDGGPDDIRFVIALCPNCHRRVHAGADGASYNGELKDRMRSIEP